MAKTPSPATVQGILYDEAFLAHSVKIPLSWDMQKSPHALITGVTGSGKSYFIRLLLGKISLYIKDCELTVCDFKSDTDYDFLNGHKGFYRFLGCIDGLNSFYNRLLARQSGEDKSRHMLILLFEEWSAFCGAIGDKKQLEDMKRKLATLLGLGRSFNVQVIISMQRADAVHFGTARDNFNFILTLGNMSKEAREMLFSDFKEEIQPDRKRGTGYMLLNGSDFKAVTVPIVRNEARLFHYIVTALKNHTKQE